MLVETRIPRLQLHYVYFRKEISLVVEFFFNTLTELSDNSISEYFNFYVQSGTQAVTKIDVCRTK